MSVLNSLFQNNTSTSGGAISAVSYVGNPILSKFVIESSRFINNTAEKDGGSLYLSCP